MAAVLLQLTAPGCLLAGRPATQPALEVEQPPICIDRLLICWGLPLREEVQQAVGVGGEMDFLFTRLFVVRSHRLVKAGHLVEVGSV